ncbi:MAG: glycosyltransferase family 2 protein [bacterium]
MSEAIIITPVKDSIKTTLKTIEAVYASDADFDYYIFNDFSRPESRNQLAEAQQKFGFHLIHLEDITSNPSPNYKLVLQIAQSIAREKELPLIIIESDVVVKKDTVSRLLEIQRIETKPALIGAITIDIYGNYNFPYNDEKIKSSETMNTSRSLSFCCTLISRDFLKEFDFKNLSQKKDWYDVFISRQAKKQGFHNYLAKGIEVLHQPHSSRPWKNLKYTNPLLYYYKKFVHKRDRI